MYLSQKWWFLWLRLVRTWVVKNEGDTSPGTFINWQTFVSMVIIIIMDIIAKVGGFFLQYLYYFMLCIVYLGLQHVWSRFETFEFVLSEYCFDRFYIVPRMLFLLGFFAFRISLLTKLIHHCYIVKCQWNFRGFLSKKSLKMYQKGTQKP